MDNSKIKYLIDKYQRGVSTKEEEFKLIELFKNNEDMGEFEEYRFEFLYTDFYKNQSTNKDFKINASDKETKQGKIIKFSPFFLRIAASILLLIGGFGLGRITKKQPNTDMSELSSLKSEVNDLKTMVVQALINKEQANDRVKAIALVNDLGNNISEEVFDLLITSAQTDENPNVRLASINTLKKFEASPKIQSALLELLINQDSPLVQIKLLQILKEINNNRKEGILKQFILQKDLDIEVKNAAEKMIKTI